MRGINKVQLLGRLGQDVEVRRTQAGNSVATCSLATSEVWTKDGNKHEETTWHDLVAFGRTGEILAQYCRKGSLLFVEGKIRKETYEKDGQKRYATKIVVRELQMLDTKPANQSQDYGPPPGVGSDGQGDYEDSIPF